MREPDDVIHDVMIDAVLRYVRHPERYDPARWHPVAWLVTVVRNRLKDRWRRAVAHGGLELVVGLDVDWIVTASAQAIRPDDPVARAELAAEVARRIRAVTRTPGEARFLLVRCAGGSMEEQAGALGCGHLAAAEQRRVVHRAWHRIHMRLLRGWATRSR